MKKRNDELPEMQWTSMIDIIFQLLIFFLVTLAMGTMETQSSARVKGEEKKDLPKLPQVEKLAPPSEMLDGFILHINNIKKPPFNGDLGAYILDAQCPELEDANKDATGSHGPFTLEKAKKVLQDRIENIVMTQGIRPRLELRADEKTPYGFVLDVMEFCDADSIEVVGFRFANKRKEGK